MVYLSPCAKDYVKTLANPINGPLGCVPSFYPSYTKSIRTFAKGSLSASNANGGFVWFNPSAMAVNDAACVLYTNGLYAGTGSYGIGTGVATAVCNSPYAVADVNATSSGIQYRVVGACIRIRYAGTALEKGGTITSLRDPTHSTLDTRLPSDVALDQTSRRFKPSNDWHQLNYAPAKASDYQLISETTFISAPITADDAWYMGFQIQCASSSPQLYDWEAYSVLEIQGRIVPGIKMRHSDPNAVALGAMVSNASQGSSQPPKQQEESFIQTAERYLSTGISYAGQAAQLFDTASSGYNAIAPYAGALTGDVSFGEAALEGLALLL